MPRKTTGLLITFTTVLVLAGCAPDSGDGAEPVPGEHRGQRDGFLVEPAVGAGTDPLPGEELGQRGYSRLIAARHLFECGERGAGSLSARNG